MYNITGSGSDNYTTRMGPGNPLNQGGINFLNRYRQGVQPGGFNITQSGGSLIDDFFDDLLPHFTH